MPREVAVRIPCAIPLVVLLACVPGCGTRHEEDTTNGGVAAAPVANDALPTARPGSDEQAEAAVFYACDAGIGVAILHDGHARVSLHDGSKVELARIGGSKPAVFTGSSLYFTVEEHGAHLSQQDETNELACQLR